MDSGSVTAIVDKSQWPALAPVLQGIFLPIQQEIEDLDERAEYVVNLCTVYYAHGRQRVIWTRDTQEDADQLGKDNLEKLVDFLEKFMEGNGQWAYIKRRKWYTSGEFAIGIDVNYYPDRSEFKTFLAFHKDTGGNNIFVNLVFDNQTMIEATEWYVDLADPSKQRKEWQIGLLPESYLEELAHARETLRAKLGGKELDVAGGVSDNLYTYVSWVDDLIWHSTPNGDLRVEYGVAHAERAWTALEASVGGAFRYEDEKLGMTILGAEILGTIAESSHTRLFKWLQGKGLNSPDLGYKRCCEAWQALYSDTAGKDVFVQDAQIRGRTPWRITGTRSEANAYDKRLEESESIDEPPVRLSQLRRTNSREDVRKKLEEARKASAGQARAFIRTWVRILKANDAELTGLWDQV